MAYTTIDDPSEYFNTVLYTGTGNAGHAITGVGFQPDWIWIKNRTATYYHCLADTNRGITRNVSSNASDTEVNYSNISAVGSDGFTVGNNELVNKNNQSLVAWNWKCNGGTNASNTDGSITSTVQVNDDAGFSIVLYTGNETDGATIGHGLSAAPDVVIVKNRETARTWLVGHSAYVNGGNSENLRFNSTDAVASADSKAGSGWSRTAFGSSVFTVGNGSDGDYTSSTNNGSDDHVAYCFRSIQGYSKIGSYVGNGNANGAFTYTGFKPAFIIIKNTASSGTNWQIVDIKRKQFNGQYAVLAANTTGAESGGTGANGLIDILSNGFKQRYTGSDLNQSGAKFIYVAFAENPFVSSKGVPTTAR